MRPITENMVSEYGANIDYNELIATFEYTQILEDIQGDYQGTVYVLLQDGERLGILIYSYGSCSGCDGLQACESLKDLVDLQKELYESIKWYNNKNELYAKIYEGTLIPDYCDTTDFIAEIVRWLDKETPQSSDEAAFLNRIKNDPFDDLPKKIYADWLDDHGRYDEAQIWRKAKCPPKCERKGCNNPKANIALGDWARFCDYHLKNT
jgi:uncharacterized protein (TIGR02996 family)